VTRIDTAKAKERIEAAADPDRLLSNIRIRLQS
jgi:hypothetical protein